MSRAKCIMTVLSMLGAVILTWSVSLEAQVKKKRVDLTGQQSVAPEQIIEGLTPPPRTRGVEPGNPTVAITVLFDFDSAVILSDAMHNLNSLGQALQSSQLAPYRIRVEGHTDSVGSDQYNLQLSTRRAESVKQYLVRNFRIAAERLRIEGLGEREPITDNGTAEGRQKNRRVEFVNIGAQ
jgi:OmpA-OmpF porin, OOP family